MAFFATVIVHTSLVMKVLCFLLVVVPCAFGTDRIFYPEENDLNYKRFHLLISRFGDKENIDLFDEPVVTTRATSEDMSYYLYTRNNVDNPQTVKHNALQDSGPYVDPAKRLFVIIHGWVDDYTADVNTLVKAALLNKYDANVIVVDWSPVASQSYITASSSVTTIGEHVANFINSVIDTNGLSGSQITLVGHSLGAHIAGNAGSNLKIPAAQIIGLDPAAPLFTVDNTENRLDPSDAQYVQIIHTNGRFLGFSSSIGHADFYPNGGMIQAGCGIDLLGGCSHARSFQYLAEAINGAQFTATLCGSYADYGNNKCNSNIKTSMGLIDVDRSVVGDFFLDTNTAEPFAKN